VDEGEDLLPAECLVVCECFIEQSKCFFRFHSSVLTETKILSSFFERGFELKHSIKHTHPIITFRLLKFRISCVCFNGCE